jgi:hypothetical protein
MKCFVAAKLSPDPPPPQFIEVLPVAKNQQAEADADRRSKDRRAAEDRRKQNVTIAVERRQGVRRVKVQRRRQIDPTTCERDYNDDEIEFMHALDAYKRTSGRMFPTCSEILEVIRNLGYVRVNPTTAPAAPAETRESVASVEAR